MPPKSTPNTTCDTCGKPFYKRPGKKRETRNNWCSVECRKQRVTVPCEHCGTRFEVQRWKTTTGKRLYCSRTCMLAGRGAIWREKRVPPVDRFWDSTHVASDDDCWEWQGPKSRKGYGRLFLGEYGCYQAAHRFSWELANGPIPDGLHVCHHCDNPSCVNPAHLFLGTNQDNHEDKMRKGRQSRGEHIHTAKLTAEQVVAIRRRYAEGGVLQQELADEYGVARAYMSRILSRQVWRHLDQLTSPSTQN